MFGSGKGERAALALRQRGFRKQFNNFKELFAMKHMTIAIASVTLFLLVGAGAAYPNTVKTGTGRSVDHIHPTTCYPTDPRGPVYCPTSNSRF